MAGTLFVVATPIGNLGDITERAIEVLRAVPHVAAEDTRRARVLLDHLGVGTKPQSLPAFDERGRADSVLAPVVAGEDLALVTDAGTPAISDPGGALVARAVELGLNVVPIPGACAAVAAVSVAALPTDRFVFIGFLPRKGQGRARLLEQLRTLPMAVVLYESPHRIAETCADLAEVWGDRRAVVARELTKLHEELLRGTLSELASRLGQGEVKGEIVLVVEGAPEAAEEALTPEALEAEIRRQLAAGDKPIKEIARTLAEALGRPRKEIYELALKLAGKS
ncbi:MAG: 16S rRNA (cytidine(1402)-2'-O)-methyltransferase [Deltaproteobacteria bacterium]|nr:16S rRNA (cytidine(1402)-2'-O)-methyltransferase [Deltaproteobacteria bacterium]